MKQYNLKLTQEELDVIYGILQRIGGSPDTSPRMYATSVLLRLEGHQVHEFPNSAVDGAKREIHFKDFPDAAPEVVEL